MVGGVPTARAGECSGRTAQFGVVSHLAQADVGAARCGVRLGVGGVISTARVGGGHGFPPERAKVQTQGGNFVAFATGTQRDVDAGIFRAARVVGSVYFGADDDSRGGFNAPRVLCFG